MILDANLNGLKHGNIGINARDKEIT